MKIKIEGVSEEFDGEYDAVQPQEMTLKAFHVFQIQSGIKTNELREAMNTAGGSILLMAFASLKRAGKRITYKEVEAFPLKAVIPVREPGDTDDPSDEDDDDEDPTPARTDSRLGDDEDDQDDYPES